MGNKAFACEADAIEAAKAFEKKLRYHSLTYRKKGRPTAPDEPVGESWYIRGEVEKAVEAIERSRAS